ISNLCEKLGGYILQGCQGLGSYSRLCYPFIFPGAGYGGSCFPKDVQALVKMGEQNSYQLQILEAVEAVNERQKKVLFNKLKNRFGADLKNKTIAVWGLAFKPNTDDMREAPSIVLIENLLAEGAKVRAYDPEATKEAQKVFGDRIAYGKKVYEILDGADALVIVTEWNEFRRPDFDKMKGLLKQPVIFDGRNLFEPKKMAQLGFEYEGIGRKQ
ncbi:MAG TPA: UDP binding domain-containing protein, partial [Candidatus Rifleibacterium sp.]|nr:UDP binding domain-containing protein [Candidatus Rifleibacterium sp.]